MAQPKKKLGNKSGIVSDVSTLLKNNSTVILTEYRGLSVPQTGALRVKLSEVGETDYSVIKNTLFKRAAAGILPESAELTAALEGPTAVVFAKDPLATAKAIADFITANRGTPFKVKGGIVDGKFTSAAEFDTLAKIPSRDTLLAMLLGSFKAPITLLAATLKSVADKKAAEA
jgi:large subunit ribosomal protein L10